MLKKLLCATGLLLAFNAHAVYRMYIYESGANVILSGSGTLNLPGTHLPGGFLFSFGGHPGVIRADTVFFISGEGTFVGYPATGPATITSASLPAVNADSRTGQGARVDCHGFACYVSSPLNYVAGASMAETMTFNNKTLASMLLVPGTYTWVTSGGVTDSIVMVVGSAPPVPTIPTLSEWGMLILSALLALGAFFVIRRGRQNRA